MSTLGESDQEQMRTSATAPGPTISVCICTCDRPESLRACLESILAGDELPDEILVSDDSQEPESTQTICADFDRATYLAGPRRGLWANRNILVRACSGDWVSFMDDDATVSRDFLRISREIVAQAPPSTIYTGRVVNDGILEEAPGGRTFLGHFGSIPRARLENVHIECSNLFPRSAFAVARFDETLKYGYADMDLMDQLLMAGFQVDYRPELLNYHRCPQTTERRQTRREIESTRARFYVSLKHYLRRGSILGVVSYASIATIHEAAHRVQARNGLIVLGAIADMRWALGEAISAQPRSRGRVRTRLFTFWHCWLDKPHYLFRPSQFFRRVWSATRGRSHDQPSEIILPWGLPIRFREDHSSGAALARTGIYDLCVTETLYRLAEPGELAVDVGANIGYMTSVLATKVGPTGRVLSVEPNPEPMALLSSNVARWVSKDGSAAITVRESAMSDKSGVARLYAPDEHEWSSLLPPKDARPSDMLEVRADRLDELIDGPIGVLKIDAEGAELKVLRGAEKLLERRWIRDVIFEEHNRYPTEVTRFLEDRGFSVFRIDQAFLGVRISAPGKEPPLSWDPPSYLATLDPDRALTLLRKKGWAVFGFPA